MGNYWKRRFNVMIAAFVVLAAGWGWMVYQHYRLRSATPQTCEEKEHQKETARVMEFKVAWAECVEDVERYVEDSREIVCWDTLVDWQEQVDKEYRRCEYVGDLLHTCEDDVARMKRDWHPAHITPHTVKACKGYACLKEADDG